MTKILTDALGKVLVNASGQAYIAPEGSAPVTHPNPSISVNTSTGLITASHTQQSGQVTGGTTTATEQLTTQGAQTITPTTSNQTIAAGKYLTGAQTIEGDANLVAGNIKDGVTIFGVEGTYEGASGSVLVPTAGDYPVIGNSDMAASSNSSTLTATAITITIPVSGTYRFKWVAFRQSTSTSYTWQTRLYRTRNNTTTAIGTLVSSWTNSYYQFNSQDIAVEKNDVITIYASGRTGTYMRVGHLFACVAQKLWTN